jgi:hypothetical protein
MPLRRLRRLEFNQITPIQTVTSFLQLLRNFSQSSLSTSQTTPTYMISSSPSSSSSSSSTTTTTTTTTTTIIMPTSGGGESLTVIPKGLTRFRYYGRDKPFYPKNYQPPPKPSMLPIISVLPPSIKEIYSLSTLDEVKLALKQCPQLEIIYIPRLPKLEATAIYYEVMKYRYPNCGHNTSITNADDSFATVPMVMPISTTAVADRSISIQVVEGYPPFPQLQDEPSKWSPLSYK